MIAATDQLEVEKSKMHELNIGKDANEKGGDKLLSVDNNSSDTLTAETPLQVASTSTLSQDKSRSPESGGFLSVLPFNHLAEDSNSGDVLESAPNIFQTVPNFQVKIDTNQSSKYNITSTKTSAKMHGKTDNMGREWPSTGKKSKFCFPQDVIDPHIPLSHQSVRRIRRENTILEAVRMSKVIVDPSALHKLIMDQERKEGGHDGSG